MIKHFARHLNGFGRSVKLYISSVKQLLEKGFEFIKEPSEVKMYLDFLECNLSYDILLIKTEDMEIVSAWGGCAEYHGGTIFYQIK